MTCNVCGVQEDLELDYHVEQQDQFRLNSKIEDFVEKKLSGATVICEDHNKLRISAKCTKCNCFLCLKCHKDHKEHMDDIEDASEDVIFENLSKDREAIRERIKKLNELDS